MFTTCSMLSVVHQVPSNWRRKVKCFNSLFHHGILWNGIKVVSLIKQCIGHNMKRIKVFIQYNNLTISRQTYPETELGYISSPAFKRVCQDFPRISMVSPNKRTRDFESCQTFLICRIEWERNFWCFFPKYPVLTFSLCSCESTTRIVQFQGWHFTKF